MKLISKKQQMVLKNQKLVYYLVHKLGITPNHVDYEDVVSIGTIGLIKAVNTFDESKKNTFATYASRCIRNEILCNYFRKANKYANDISLNEPIGNDGEGNEITLAEIIQHPNSDFVEKLAIKDSFVELVSIILNCLKSKERIIMLYRMGNLTQEDIGKILNISRSYVSRIEQVAALKIRKIVNEKIYYKEVFSMAIIKDSYRISFSSKDISNFNKIFVTLLKDPALIATLPDFKVVSNEGRIIIQLPADPESFSFISKIIQEIDNFSLAFVSGKNTLPTDDTNSHEVMPNEKREGLNSIEETETSIIEQISDTSSDIVDEDENGKPIVETGISETVEEADDETSTVTHVNVDSDTVEETSETMVENPIIKDTTSTSSEVAKSITTDSTSASEKGTYVTQVRDYMLTLDSFTVSELKQHFSKLPSNAITNAIYLAKSKNLIASTETRGKYVVNKT